LTVARWIALRARVDLFFSSPFRVSPSRHDTAVVSQELADRRARSPDYRAAEANQPDQQVRQPLPNQILFENREPHFRISPGLKSDRHGQGPFAARGRFPLPQSIDRRLIEEFVACRLNGLDIRHVTFRVEGQPKLTRA